MLMDTELWKKIIVDFCVCVNVCVCVFVFERPISLLSLLQEVLCPPRYMEAQEGVLLWARRIYNSAINKCGTVGEERKKEW
jgi:hypothetical protein